VRRYEWTMLTAVRALLAGLAICQAGSAHAATFSVNPTQVFLTRKSASALVTVRNESEEAVRFQLAVLAWDQAPDGQMKLSPTQDIVFFPQLFSLAGHEERKVRVGTLLAPASIEKTYRLFVEELPAPDSRAEPGTVRVLAKMSLPIFLRTSETPLHAELRNLAVAGGRLSFTLANKGTTHFVPERVSVRAVGPGGEPVGEQALNAWYILAGSTRVFELDLPNAPVATLVVEVRLPGAVRALTERLELPRDVPHPPQVIDVR
jgi:fimbrial chaperone protein